MDFVDEESEWNEIDEQNLGNAQEPQLAPAICFPAGTMVSTSSGQRPIERLQTLDLVCGYDFSNWTIVIAPIVGVTRGSTTTWVENASAGEVTRATMSHPFWVESLESWIEASQLLPGMTLRCQGGNLVEVSSAHLLKLDEKEETYNLSVDQCANFFVGNLQLLVHNIYREN